jgi:hypothetical protein
MSDVAISTSELGYDKQLLSDALTLWCPAAQHQIICPLPGGYSGAVVLIIDIQQTQPNTKLPAEALPSGTYVLKLDANRCKEGNEPDEAKRHADACLYAPAYAKKHIPPLRRFFRQGEKVAMLYEIAGGSLTRLIRSDYLTFSPLVERVRKFSESLLSEFNENNTVTRNTTVTSLLHAWLGTCMESNQNTELHILARAITEGRRSFLRSLHVLANPMEIGRGSLGGKVLPTVFSGLLHGDLYTENLFWDRPPSSNSFWLIDFAYSKSAPLFFDHAYFELSFILQKLKGTDPSRLLSLLDCLDQPPENLGAKFISQDDEGLRTVVASFRSGIGDWQKREQGQRTDAVEEQWLLARIAAGINWANIPLDREVRELAFYYAAQAARQYLEKFHPDLWKVWAKDMESRNSILPMPVIPEPLNMEWTQLWSEMAAFTPSDRYILLAGPLGDSKELASLGLLPWSAVIDFDCASDVRGLLKSTRENLEKERSLHFFGREPSPVNFARGTAWMMAAGSNTLKEQVPKNVLEWRRSYKEAVGRLASTLHEQSAPSTVRILVLPGGTNTPELFIRALEEIVDELGENRRVVVACAECDRSKWTCPEVNQVVGLCGERVAQFVQSIYGASLNTDVATVPGKRGPVELDPTQLRNFEEDFEVLHSDLLTKVTFDDDRAFWRGAPPTWREIETQAPMPRNVITTLVPTIRTSLKNNSTTKIELYHTPGAGGTTVALTAAWMLRTEYPTAVLRTPSRSTADRVSWLFQLTGLPVLLIADASVLSRTELEELLRKLAHENTRAVVLHVQRVTNTNAHSFTVYDPMSLQEADLFAKAFCARTPDYAKKTLLNEIGLGKRQDLKALRSPFFFGLVTFETAFTQISEYVDHHLADASYPERKLIQYLSLIAAHSQASISPALARKLMNLAPDDNRELSNLVCSAAGRLILEWDNTVKMVHPLIGEEVLRKLGGGETWKLGLTDLCIDFARNVLEASGGYTKEASQLFKNLFIEREDWSEDETTGRRDKFSRLLERLPNDAARGRLLEALTNLCPKEAHFWNHRGRHGVYSATPNYEQSEAFLLKAIELSEGHDRLHYHALGQVRRFWIRSIVRNLRTQSNQLKTPLLPQTLLDQIKSLATGALDAFATCRKLDSEDEHGYITAIQTILYIVEELTRGTNRYAEVTTTPGAVGDWIREQIATAELLLNQLKRLRGNSTLMSSYEINCLQKMAKLHGDYTLIGKWEAALPNSSEPQSMRRAIAGLYLAKRQREWSRLEQKELRQIVKMAEDNLRIAPSDERDLRYWFEAMRRLPEFNYLEAIEHLEAWASGGNALDAFYYLYILHFLKFRAEGLDAEESIQANIDKCIERRIGERGFSHEWLAIEPEYCPLIGHREVGEWNHQTHFFNDPTQLQMIKGTIESIKPQAGILRLGRILRAFFRPPPNIREVKHLNADVYFYLGFSYDGFRAWGVQLEEPREQTITCPERAKPAIIPSKLRVSGLPNRYTELDVRTLFAPFCRVDKVEIIRQGGTASKDRISALIHIHSNSDAKRTIDILDGWSVERRWNIVVREVY